MSAESEAPISGETLSALFDKGLQLYHELCDTMDPSNSKEYQDKTKKGICILEDATRLVSSLGVFSTNENVDEVATTDLKLFLLPVLLGDLNLKLVSDNRLHILNVTEVYFKDFLTRCKMYQVAPDVTIPDETETEEEQPPPRRPGPMSFEEMAKEREQKIRKFQDKKNMESRLQELKRAIENPSADETVVRNYHLLLLKKFILSTVEELASIAQEKPIVEHIAKMKAAGADMKSASSNKSPALKPIIITRDAVQKKVYGLGYPSIPTMTVEELVKQRMKDGWYDNFGGSAGQSLLDQAKAAEIALKAVEAEETEKEEKVQKDDAEALQRARQFDDWKDDHRRGWGNRHNMG